MAREVFDIVVVGSGAGGAAAAWRLATRGLRVLVLESGPAFEPERDYLLHTNQWEQARFPQKPGSKGRHSYATMQPLNAWWRDLRSWSRVQGLMAPGYRRHVWGYHHVRGVGGSTLAFTGESHRMHPGALHLARDFGVGADWPLNYTDLEPYYVAAERLIGVAGSSADRLRPRSEPYPAPAHPHSYASRVLGAGCAKLGLRWEPNPLAVLSTPYNQRPGCY